jgi:hypothetical protein
VRVRANAGQSAGRVLTNIGMTLETIAKLLLPLPRAGGVFAESERRTLAAAADVLLEGVDFAISSDEIIRNVEGFIGGSRRAWRVRVLLAFVEHAPRFAGRARFSRASRVERARLLREGSHTAVVSLFRRVRPLVVLGAYASPKARRRVGWVEVRDRARFRLAVAS